MTTRIVDLSHPIEAGMVTYPGLPVPEIHAVLDRATSAGRYAPGVTFQIDLITLCGNTGTYMDSPFHRWEDGADLAGLPLERLVDLPAVRIDMTASATPAVDAAALRDHDLAGRAVLVHTGFDRFWRTEDYLRDNPFLTLDAVELLVGAGAALVGIDSLNIDSTADPARPAHSLLLRAGIPIVEHMTNLGAVPHEGARFTAIPAPGPGHRNVPRPGDRGGASCRLAGRPTSGAGGTDGACERRGRPARFAAPPARWTATPDAEPAPLRPRRHRRRLAARPRPPGERRGRLGAVRRRRRLALRELDRGGRPGRDHDRLQPAPERPLLPQAGRSSRGDMAVFLVRTFHLTATSGVRFKDAPRTWQPGGRSTRWSPPASRPGAPSAASAPTTTSPAAGWPCS